MKFIAFPEVLSFYAERADVPFQTGRLSDGHHARGDDVISGGVHRVRYALLATAPVLQTARVELVLPERSRLPSADHGHQEISALLRGFHLGLAQGQERALFGERHATVGETNEVGFSSIYCKFYSQKRLLFE